MTTQTQETIIQESADTIINNLNILVGDDHGYTNQADVRADIWELMNMLPGDATEVNFTDDEADIVATKVADALNLK